MSTQVEGLLKLVSPCVGVIRSLVRVRRSAEEPSPPIIYQALLSHFDFKKAPLLERAAAGKGVTDSEAIGAAIGEALERYCASHPDVRTCRRATWATAEPQTISPVECVLYSERQYARRDFPYQRWDEQTEMVWLPVRELPSDREAFVPASLIYLNYPGERPEEYLCPPTSNGLAAGPDLESAIRHGLYELIERDAFLISWMNKLPVPEVDFSDVGGVAGSLCAHYQRFGVETRVFNLATDLPVYVMMGISFDQTGQGPAALIGLGAHPDPAVALTKALFEICQVRPGMKRKYAEESPGKRLRAYADVRTLEDHAAFFTLPERLQELAFLLKHGRTQRLADLPNHARGSVQADLEACVHALRRVHCRVIYADLTTPDVRDCGIRVVRTLATGLQPMHFGYGEERLGGRRLYEVPQQLGYAAELTHEQSLNPCPHPLA